jgi:hypothetical protein
VEFPGIVETDSASIKNPGNTGEWQAASLIGFASAQMPPRARRGQGLKILAREENYIAARHKLPNSQTEWLWDCLTPQAAPAEISVSAGAVVSSSRGPSPSTVVGSRTSSAGPDPSTLLSAGRRQDASTRHGATAVIPSRLRTAACAANQDSTPASANMAHTGGVGPKLAGTD